MPEKKSIKDTLASWQMHLSRISFVQKMFFIDHLRIMMHASLSLVEALGILEREMTNKKFQGIIAIIKREVEQGRQLSEVLGDHPKVFPPIYVKMMAAGEVSGKLDEALENIVNQMRKSHALSSSVTGAMIYPAVILSAMLGLGVFMTIFVMPKLVDLFKEFNAELPLPTRALMYIMDILSNPLYLIISVSAVTLAIAGFVTGLRRFPGFRRFIHSFNLHIPIAGGIIKQINLARFSLTLSSLLKSTIPIIEATDITSETCTNIRYREALKTSAGQLKSGVPMSELLSKHPKLFPPMVSEMVMVGERTGEIDRLLAELAQFFGDGVDKTMKNFTTIIEPVIIIVLGIGVAGIAVSVILPMYTLVQNF